MAYNPYYLLPIVSGFDKDILPDSNFRPTVIVDIDVIKIVQETNILKYVKIYKSAIRAGDLDAAIGALQRLFLHRRYLFQALVESAILYVGIGDLKMVELIFSLVAGDISGLNAILVTQLMARFPIKQELLRLYITKQYSLSTKSGKLDKKKIRAGRIMDVMTEEISIDTVLEMPEIAKVVAGHFYKVLEYIDPAYYAFVFQVADVPINELIKSRKDTIELTKGTNADRKLGAAMEDGKIN